MHTGEPKLGLLPYPGTLFSACARRRVPDSVLAVAIDALNRDDNLCQGLLTPLDYRALDLHHLGALYEDLLTVPSTLKKRRHAQASRAERKSRGVYFTPSHIVDRIVIDALGPIVDKHLEELRPTFQRRHGKGIHLLDRFFDLRVLDPAMGAGYFLLAAVDYLAARMAAFLWEFPNNPVSRMLGKSASESKRSSEFQRVRQQVLQRCIHGVDVDPMVVEVARLTLYLHCTLPGLPTCALSNRLRCGNALQAATFDDSLRYDVVLGNPPYGAAVDADTLAAARKELPLFVSNPDTAVGFLERALQLVRPGGRVGFILPKPLIYSYAWREVRSALRGRVHHLADVSRAWDDVRLEQIILVASSEPTTAESYAVSALGATGFGPVEAMPWAWADRFQTLPCTLNVEERALLESLRLSPVWLGQLCKTFRGLPLQRRLRHRGRIAVVGGRDLARWQVRSCSGYVPAIEPATFSRFRVPKLVFQNIIAHIRQPKPHIQLIGAYDPAGTVTLDTVNNLVPRQPGVDLWGILALLHSDFINWFVYAVVYSKAIRTMHFDQYFVDKIPLPPDAGKLLAQLAPLARQATRLRDKDDARASARYTTVHQDINRLVNEAYGVDDLVGLLTPAASLT